MVEIPDQTALVDRCKVDSKRRFHAAEAMQDAGVLSQQSLLFTSGEALPAYWTEKDFR